MASSKIISSACSTVMFAGDLAEKLAAMAEAGFTHTEIVAPDIYGSLQGAEHALELIRQSGLQVCAYSVIRDYEACPASQIALRTLVAEQLMDHASWLATDVLIMCSNTMKEASADRARMRDDLRRLGDIAARKNIRLAYEALCWGTHIRDYRDAWDLVEAVDHPNVGLLLDSSHIGALKLPFGGIRNIDVNKLFHVQAADLPDARVADISLSRYYRLLPGDGILPLEEFFGALEAIGYSKVCALEILSDRYRAMPPRAAAQEAMRSVRRWLPAGPVEET